MTDRYNSLTVVLEKDIRDDDAQSIIEAIKQIRCVLTVEGNVTDMTNLVAEERARREITEKIWNALYPDREQR